MSELEQSGDRMVVVYFDKSAQVIRLTEFVRSHSLTNFEHLMLCRKLKALGLATYGGRETPIATVQLCP